MPSEKTCSKCCGGGPFGRSRFTKDGLRSTCNSCRREWNRQRRADPVYRAHELAANHARHKANPMARREYQAEWQKKNKEKLAAKARTDRVARPIVHMLRQARYRAKKYGLPFDLEVGDITIPELCPLLHIPIAPGREKVHANSPTLDRKIPTLGYIKGNVWVISQKANVIKQDATLEELELLVRNLRASLG
jgi:hypothetical protein